MNRYKLSIAAKPRFWRVAALGLMAAATAAGCATGQDTAITAATRTAEASRVTVSHADPASFSEARNNWNDTARARQAWLDELSRYLAQQAGARLSPGQRLEVHITDVQRAGRFEPLRGPQTGNVRTVRDVYPPRIDLDFKLLAEDGSTLRQGSRQLRDSTFLGRPDSYLSDPLRHEKALVSDWAREEFGRQG